MYTRQLGIFGWALLGLALATPVQAAPDFLDGVIIVAKRDHDDAQDDRRDHQPSDRRKLKRDDDDEGAYGYGYERRKQKRDDGDDDQPRRPDRH